jgi:hypothetical protein
MLDKVPYLMLLVAFCVLLFGFQKQRNAFEVQREAWKTCQCKLEGTECNYDR